MDDENYDAQVSTELDEVSRRLEEIEARVLGDAKAGNSPSPAAVKATIKAIEGALGTAEDVVEHHANGQHRTTDAILGKAATVIREARNALSATVLLYSLTT